MEEKVSGAKQENRRAVTDTAVESVNQGVSAGQSANPNQCKEMKSPALKLKDMLRFVSGSSKDNVTHSLPGVTANPEDVTAPKTSDCGQPVALYAPNYCFTGHFTRGAKKSLQSALNKTSVHGSSDNSNSTGSCSTTPATLTTTVTTTTSATSNISLMSSSSRNTVPSVSSSSPLPTSFFNTLLATTNAKQTVVSSGNNNNNNNNTSTGDNNSTSGESSSSSSVSKSHSIIAHILTGEDKNLGADTTALNGSFDQAPTESEKAFEEQSASLDGDCEEVVDSFLDDAICDTSSIVAKLGNYGASEWEMDSRGATSPCKEITVNSEPTAVSGSGGATLSSDCMASGVTSLLIKDESKGEELWKALTQINQAPPIRVVTSREAFAICNTESFPLIWVQVSTPVSEELLRITTSIRYSSKKNKSAYIVAVADKQPEVNLNLRGFDEVCVEPVLKETLRQKYQKLKWTALPPASTGTDTSAVLREGTTTPESTISLESIKTTECSQSSPCDSVFSEMDVHDITFSDLKCSLTLPARNKSPFTANSAHSKSPSTDPLSPPNRCRVEHATKEKQRSIGRKVPAYTEKMRRERIKDSCDQLRVLLPYVRGRKTDMASILEMTVDYLKIVNAALPQDFKSQVIDMMSTGSPLLEGRIGSMETMSMACKKMTKRRISGSDMSPLGSALQTVEKKPSVQAPGLASSDTRMITRSLSRTVSSTMTEKTSTTAATTTTINNCANNTGNTSNNLINGIFVAKRECPTSIRQTNSKAKRAHMAVMSSVDDSQSPSVYLPTGTVTPMKEPKKENIVDDVTGQSHHFSSLQFPHMFTEGDISANRMFSSGHMTGGELFPYQHHSQMNLPSSRGTGTADRGSDAASYGGMYLDGAFYHYYSSLQDSSNGNYFLPAGSNEYVNPNAVLPMTSHTPRVTSFNSGRKFERTTATDMDRFGVNENSELFHSNCSGPGVKPTTP